MSTADTYDAIVIGGGPNGLLCAAYLAKAGNTVLLLERRHETGGGLNTDEYYGFRLNLHAIYHMMAEIMPAWYQSFGSGVPRRSAISEAARASSSRPAL